MARNKVIKACQDRWTRDECEGMYEGYRWSKRCPTCKALHAKARFQIWANKNRERIRANNSRYHAERKEIRQRLGLRGHKRVTKQCQNCQREFVGIKLSKWCPDCARARINARTKAYRERNPEQQRAYQEKYKAEKMRKKLEALGIDGDNHGA